MVGFCGASKIHHGIRQFAIDRVSHIQNMLKRAMLEYSDFRDNFTIRRVAERPEGQRRSSVVFSKGISMVVAKTCIE